MRERTIALERTSKIEIRANGLRIDAYRNDIPDNYRPRID
jgi:hypothetical protein